MDFTFTMAKKLFSISLVLCIHAHSVWLLLNHISPFNLPCTNGKSVDIVQSWKNVPLQEGEKNVGRRKGEEAGYKQGDTHHYRGRRDFTCMPRNANLDRPSVRLSPVKSRHLFRRYFGRSTNTVRLLPMSRVQS